MSINISLAKKMKLTEEEIKLVESLQNNRIKIEIKMKALDPTKDKGKLLLLLGNWRENEFALQRAWGFEENRNMHREYMVPHCLCPKMDNEDWLGTKYRDISEDCIYHGMN